MVAADPPILRVVAAPPIFRVVTLVLSKLKLVSDESIESSL